MSRTNDPEDGQTLLTLGKRTERLLFFGLLLTGLTVAALFVTVITVRFEEDRNLRAIRSLSESFQSRRSQMETLFELSKLVVPKLQTIKPAPPSPPPRRIRPSKEIAEKRAALGLPETTTDMLMPEIPRLPTFSTADPEPSPFADDYAKFLRAAVEEVTKEIGNDANLLESYADPKQSPQNLIARLNTERQNIERQPVDFLGLRGPRAIAVEYLGANFQLQYGFISTALLLLLGPLLSGWLTSLYMTRQREMYEVARASSYGDVFPHIMNFVPVTLSRSSRKPLTDIERSALIALYGALRVLMSLAILAPVLGAYVATVWISWPYSDAAALAVPFLAYILVQFLFLIGQEGNGMHNVYFAEV